jgi:hypothetical protein
MIRRMGCILLDNRKTEGIKGKLYNSTESMKQLSYINSGEIVC